MYYIIAPGKTNFARSNNYDETTRYKAPCNRTFSALPKTHRAETHCAETHCAELGPAPLPTPTVLYISWSAAS